MWLFSWGVGVHLSLGNGGFICRWVRSWHNACNGWGFWRLSFSHGVGNCLTAEGRLSCPVLPEQPRPALEFRWETTGFQGRLQQSVGLSVRTAFFTILFPFCPITWVSSLFIYKRLETVDDHFGGHINNSRAERREAGPVGKSWDLAFRAWCGRSLLLIPLREGMWLSALGELGGNLSTIVQNLEMDPASSPLLLTAHIVPLSHWLLFMEESIPKMTYLGAPVCLSWVSVQFLIWA